MSQENVARSKSPRARWRLAPCWSPGQGGGFIPTPQVAGEKGLLSSRPRLTAGEMNATRQRYPRRDGSENTVREIRRPQYRLPGHGEGPLDIVLIPSFVSNIEFWWTSPIIKAWLDRLASFARLILFDKAGTGLSDPIPGPRTLEQRAEEIEAVMDTVGSQRAVLFGLSEGGPMSIVFTATRPGRVQALVLMGTFAISAAADSSPDEMRADLANKGIPERYWPTDAQLERLAVAFEAVRERWGEGEMLAALLPSLGDTQQLGTLERVCASPGMARATMQSAAMINIVDVLPTIGVPTLVVHADEDLVPVQGGRFIADRIPGARMFEVKGRDHAPWLADHPELIADEIEEFLTGARHVTTPDRVLSTVLFTDIVAPLSARPSLAMRTGVPCSSVTAK